MKNDIKQVIKKIIMTVSENILIDEIDDNDSLIENGMDSMEYVFLIVQLETTYGIKFEDDMINYEKLNSIEGFSNYIYSKMQ